MRKALLGALLLLALAAGSLYYAYARIGDILSAGVERYGPPILQAETHLGGALVSPFTGEGSLSDLQIGNPKGFASDRAITAREVRVAVDLDTLRADPIVIREIVVDSPKILYERTLADSNLDALRRNVRAYALAHASSKKKDEAPGRRVVVRELTIRNATVRLAVGGVPGAEGAATIPEIRLRNLGEGGKGATAPEIVGRVLDALLPAVTKAAVKLDPEAVAGEAVRQATRAAEGVVGGAAEAVKGLFGE